MGDMEEKKWICKKMALIDRPKTDTTVIRKCPAISNMANDQSGIELVIFFIFSIHELLIIIIKCRGKGPPKKTKA